MGIERIGEGKVCVLVVMLGVEMNGVGRWVKDTGIFLSLTSLSK